MHKKTKVPTPYGPIDVDVVSCDGPQCTLTVLQGYMVGWHRLVPQGIEVPTFGSNPDPLDYCSLTCLSDSVSLMTGTQS